MNVTIIALADSHATSVQELPEPLRAALPRANIIVHAGDHTEMSFLQELQAMAQVIAVAGNMDSLALKVHLPHRQLLTVNGKTVGVIHGSGARTGIAQRVRGLFPEKLDLILFGHSHAPFNAIVDGVCRPSAIMGHK